MNKTAKEWFELVEDEVIKERLIKNTPSYNLNYRQSSLSNAIYMSFVWGVTPEGYTYWKTVRDNCDKLLIDKKEVMKLKKDGTVDRRYKSGVKVNKEVALPIEKLNQKLYVKCNNLGATISPNLTEGKEYFIITDYTGTSNYLVENDKGVVGYYNYHYFEAPYCKKQEEVQPVEKVKPKLLFSHSVLKEDLKYEQRQQIKLKFNLEGEKEMSTFLYFCTCNVSCGARELEGVINLTHIFYCFPEHREEIKNHLISFFNYSKKCYDFYFLIVSNNTYVNYKDINGVLDEIAKHTIGPILNPNSANNIKFWFI